MQCVLAEKQVQQKSLELMVIFALCLKDLFKLIPYAVY